MAGSRIAGRYELETQLGEGGMGVVWRALDIKTGSYVAIKLMKDISDPVAVDLFTKEWKALAEMCHPNIVDVRDVDVIEENRQKKPFFVMPLLRGATLGDLITNASARLTLTRIVEITTQVCKGLQAAHQRGLVHRDLKPSNIFVMDDDTAKIIDFGVVHLAGSKSVTGQKGTFQYMSPEQAQLKQITPASDLFSLGVILYEALTLRKPFARNTADETMQAVIQYIPPPVSEINPSINQSVSKVVHKCLAKQPIHRFASARELAETLQKAFRDEPIFDAARIEPRIERAKTAFKSGDEAFASEILAEIEAEGNLDPRITVLRMQIEMAVKQKKIRQLLESARARMEQEEIPLALDKVREVLELDSQNPDALAMRETMEKQRSETQIAKWFDLAQTHLANRDFGAARHAVREILAIRSGDTRALDLMEKIESTEADAKRIREQKEQLYGSALRAYQNGEIDTALSKLERLFSVARANPIAAIPERDAVYQSFYKEVRSERDTIHSALEDAQRQVSEKNFAGAMEVCRDLLEKYPNDGTFQALRIRIEDGERQELSSYIAEVSKRVDSEPDLDRRANILRGACDRYPNEAQFAQQLKLVRERRDLVNSVVAKARQYEERGQFSEAISQWDILRNIHPQYPGIVVELEQCKKKRDRQVHEEEHARLVQEIDGLMEGRAYAKAIECARAALQDNPGDAELAGLQTLAEQGLERTKESRRLFEDGQGALAERDLARAAELLRSSLQMDPRGPGLRDAVITVLVERARLLVDENWRDAEPLYQEASDLDPNHPAVRGLRSFISEAKRQNFVGQCLTDARSLVAAGNSQAAAERIRAGRAEYPNDPRLEQYEASLMKEVKEVRRKQERIRDRDALGEDRRALETLEPNPDRGMMREFLERSITIRAKHPDDPEIEQTVAEIELAIKRAAKVDDLSQLLRVETLSTGTDGRRGPAAQPSPPRGQDRQSGPKLVDRKDDKTKVFRTDDRGRQTEESPTRAIFREVSALFEVAQKEAIDFLRPAGTWSGLRLGVLGAVIIVIGYLVLRPTHKPKPPSDLTKTVQVRITAEPPDSTVTRDSQPITEGAISLLPGASATVAVSRLGYKTREVQLRPESDGKITLEPELLHLSIQTAGLRGSVELDGQNIGTLSGGALDEYDVAPDGRNHKLTVTAKGKRLLGVDFRALAGSLPQLNALEGTNVFLVTSLGNSATVFGNSVLHTIQFQGQTLPVGPAGTALSLTEQSREIRFSEGTEQGSLLIDIANAPALAVHSITAEGQVRITTNAEGAVLTVDGQPVPRQKQGWRVTLPPGTYHFLLSAEGHEPQQWTMTMRQGQILGKHVALAPKVVLPTLAKLVITGGTPGAVVDLDGQRIGELDASGGLQVPNLLNAGKHMLALAKVYYDSRVFELSPNPPSEVRLANAVLTPWATLGFQIAPRTATVKYRRVGDTQFRDANPSARTPLASAQYEIVAEATGFQEYRTVITLVKESLTLPVNLKPIPDYEFLDAAQITHDGEWIRSKNRDRFVYLRPGFLHENLVFAKPSPSLFGKKKVQWVVEAPDGRIQYELDGQKLTRKLVVADATSDQIETKANAASASQPTSFSLHIRVDGARVRITNDAGAVLDDYTVSDHDLANAKIGIRTDSQFTVRRDNP